MILPFDVPGWNSSKNGYSPGFSGLTTTDDLAPGPSTFSILSGLLSNSIGVRPSLAISILMRLPAGTSRLGGVNTPSRATIFTVTTSSAANATGVPRATAKAPARRVAAMRISVTTFLAGAGIREFVLERERREPRRHARFLVDVAPEHLVRARRRWGDAELQRVAAGARELDVVAVVRAVARDHRHQRALDHVARALLDELVADVEVRHPRAVGEAVGVPVGGVDVRFEVDVGCPGVAHHPRRVHRDRLQVHRGDLEAVADLRLADRVFERQRGAGDCQGEREEHAAHIPNSLILRHSFVEFEAGGRCARRGAHDSSPGPGCK